MPEPEAASLESAAGERRQRAVLDLACALIERESVSPCDAGCQDLLIERLENAGFAVERMPFGPVANFWATRGAGAPVLAFAGHTDVVPSGPRNAWRSPPFAPTVRGGMLFGRGAADMKSSLAAMVVAAEEFARARPRHGGTLAFLVTSDEEDRAVDGTARVVRELLRRSSRIDYCVVGEPSSRRRLGDTVRIGRRGSLNGAATVRGAQGHVAYPDQADNPIHSASRALAALAATRWDAGDADFPPTSFQVSNIRAGTGADNVIPGELECRFNFRFSPAQTPEALQAAVARAFADADARCDVDWRLSGQPFITRSGALIDATRQAIRDAAGIETETSTSGGTSDGRFIAPMGAQVVELGPVNATIHKIDECVRVADLGPLAALYARIAQELLG